MVHVTDMAAAVSFYETLGAQVVQGSKDGDWVLLRVAGGDIGLLAHQPNPEQNEGTVELSSRPPFRSTRSRNGCAPRAPRSHSPSKRWASAASCSSRARTAC